jgi:DeoR/GlpR family transcriptional regulator of sugar metabolism
MAGLTHRQTEILNIARASGRVMVEDLARRFDVSAPTIRKDLNDLCEQRSLIHIDTGPSLPRGSRTSPMSAAFCSRRGEESDRSGGCCADPERLLAVHQ